MLPASCLWIIQHNCLFAAAPCTTLQPDATLPSPQ
jgi:hypothetical protein